MLFNAEVAKLVDALALGASGAIRGGSSPLLGTLNKRTGCFIHLVLLFNTDRGLERRSRCEYLEQH